MNYGIIPVTSDVIFEWLGPATAFRRSIEKLTEIRELDRIVIAVYEPDQRLGLVAREMNQVDVQPLVVMIPRNDLSLLDLAMQLEHDGDLPDASHILMLNPLFPLISAENVERAMQAALSPEHKAAVTVLPELRSLVQIAALGYDLRRDPVCADACLAIACGLLKRPIPLNTLPIVLTQIEAVNIGSDEGLRLANALFLGFI